ncbi:MAG: Fic family protein, partial [Anaerovoracaceae bacterium]
VDYIWKSANLEGIAITFPDTEAIYNGLSIEGYKVDEIIAVNNLKRAWNFILDTIDLPININYICEINKYVGGDSLIRDAGKIRNIGVRMGGTNWKPEIPIESQTKEELNKIINNPSKLDRGVDLSLYLMRKQIFLDGNNRTAMLAGNHELIKEGIGILSVPIEKQRDFSYKLIQYYETGDTKEIKNYILKNCIDLYNPKTKKEKISIDTSKKKQKERER